MMSRHDVTDQQWEILEPLIPKQKPGAADHVRMIAVR